MKFIFFGAILILTFIETLTIRAQTIVTPIEVISFKWSKESKKVVRGEDSSAVTAQSLGYPANRTFERNRRVNDPMGKPDPNSQTIEGRSAELEKIVQESRSPKLDPLDGYLYQTKIRNTGKSVIEILYWQYDFKERANPANIVSRQFLCGVKIKSNKEKEISVFSSLAPNNVISVGSLENKSHDLFEEKITINRIEFADGTSWQRNDWNFSVIKSSITRALETPWGNEMCRNL